MQYKVQHLKFKNTFGPLKTNQFRQEEDLELENARAKQFFAILVILSDVIILQINQTYVFIHCWSLLKVLLN